MNGGGEGEVIDTCSFINSLYFSHKEGMSDVLKANELT